MPSPSFFYAFADEAAALAAGALVNGDDGPHPADPEALILRTGGIELVLAVTDPATGDIITPATLSAPLVILSPVMLPGCSSALIDPPGHQGFA